MKKRITSGETRLAALWRLGWPSLYRAVLNRIDGHRSGLARKRDGKRGLTDPKKSEMLEIRISYPLKQALTEHCKSTGTQRSAFVRAAIEERITRERQAASRWLAAGSNAAALMRSGARAFGVAGLILTAGFYSALAVRPDASAMASMAQLTELTRLVPDPVSPSNPAVKPDGAASQYN